MFVEDNEHQKKLIECYALKTPWLKLEMASDIGETIELLRTETPDVIFLDSRIVPYSDYRETVPIIRRIGYEGKIVVVSADIQHPIFLSSSDYSVAACLDKSDLNLTTFESIVGSYLEDARA